MNGLYMAASGAASQLAGLDVAASNLANASTPGFRRLFNVVESLSGNGSPYEYAATPVSAQLDMSQGPIKATDDPLDIAITGPAFITVETPDGPAYTRNGQLQLGADGSLSAAGYPIAGQTGGTITLPPGQISIGGDGSISVNGVPSAQIALADPTGQELEPTGGGLYRPTNGESLPAATSGSQVHQGYVETSTVSEIEQMVGMMGQMRSYESTMKAITSIDNNQDQAIQAFTVQA